MESIFYEYTNTNSFEIVNIVPFSIILWLLLSFIFNFNKNLKHSNVLTFIISMLITGALYSYLNANKQELKAKYTELNYISNYTSLIKTEELNNFSTCLNNDNNFKYNYSNVYRNVNKNFQQCLYKYLDYEKINKTDYELNILEKLFLDKLLNNKENKYLLSVDNINYNMFFLFSGVVIIIFLSFRISYYLFGEYDKSQNRLINGTESNPRTNQTAVIIMLLCYLSYSIFLNKEKIVFKQTISFATDNYKDKVFEPELEKENKKITEEIKKIDKTYNHFRKEILKNSQNRKKFNLYNLQSFEINDFNLVLLSEFIKNERKDDYFYYVIKSRLYLNKNLPLEYSYKKHQELENKAKNILIKEVNKNGDTFIKNNKYFFEEEYKFVSDIYDLKTFIALKSLREKDECKIVNDLVSNIEKEEDSKWNYDKDNKKYFPSLKEQIIKYGKDNKCYTKYNSIEN